jgi:hypothetical protein
MIVRLGATNRRSLSVIAVVLAILGTGLAMRHVVVTPSRADDDDDADNTAAAPSRVTVTDGIVTLTLDAAARQNGGIRTAALALRSSPGTVTAYGTVLDAAPLTALNNRYLDAKAQLRMAEAKLAVSRAAYERAKALYKDRQSISEAQMQSAGGTFAVDDASEAAAQSRLATVMASAQQSWGPVLGQALIAGAPLIDDLIRRRTYLVRVTLPPDAVLAQAPAAASARLGGGASVALRFVSPATATDPRIQGMTYFYQAPAVDGVLPGLNVVASLPEAPAAPGVIVPAAAVVWLQGKAWLYVRTGTDTFVRRPIEPDHPGPDGSYVVTSLPAGTRAVVVGAQMLLSEEFRAQLGRGGDQD